MASNASPAAADALTAAAIGGLTAPLMLLSHELIGHGIATLLIGAHIVRVTSVNESCTRVRISRAGSHDRGRRNPFEPHLGRARSVSRTHASLFLVFRPRHAVHGFGLSCGGCDLRFRGRSSSSRRNTVRNDVAHRPRAARFVFIVTRSDAERGLGELVGNERRGIRARVFTLVPYSAMGGAAVFAGSVGPDPHFSDVGWSALALHLRGESSTCAVAAQFARIVHAGTGARFAPERKLDCRRCDGFRDLCLRRSPRRATLTNICDLATNNSERMGRWARGSE